MLVYSNGLLIRRQCQGSRVLLRKLLVGVKGYFISAHWKPGTTYRRFVVYTVISFILGLALSFYAELAFLELPILAAFLVLIGIFLLCVLTPTLGIIASLFFIRKKAIIVQVLLIGLLIGLLQILAMAIVIFAPVTLESALPFIYTPPAITQESLKVCKECIKFIKSQPEHGDMSLTSTTLPLVYFGGNSYSLRHVRVKEAFSKDDKMKMEELSRQLGRIRYHKFQRENDMVLFYRMALYSPPLLDNRSFLPIAPGVLYSLSGKNPNEISSEVLNASKPFIPIAGNWYMSRRLNLKGMRLDTLYSVPKSLIDRSLQIDDIEPNDLYINEGGRI